MNLKRFRDGLVNVINQLANRRNPAAQNVQEAQKMSDSELRSFFRTGMSQRMIGLKVSQALNDTIQFKNEAQKEKYDEHLADYVKEAVGYMLGFGRGVIVIIEADKNLDDPLSAEIDWSLPGTKIEVFGGDMVFCPSPDIDLRSPRYNKPKFYSVRGYQIHHSRVTDFKYVKPPEYNLPEYQYGGISETELIREQLVNDGIIQRAGGRIVEINSTLFHKVKGFKDSMQMGNDDAIVKYVGALADIRGIYGDGIIDGEDDVIERSQVLANLSEVDMMSLRRVSLVTGIHLIALAGDSPSGLNADGSGGRAVTQDTIESLQSNYIVKPLKEFCKVMGLDDVKFKDNQGGTANERMDYETKAIDNAVKLATLGEDYSKYLDEKDVIKPDPMSTWFPEPPISEFSDSDFDESKIERDDDGKFSSGGGGGGSSASSEFNKGDKVVDKWGDKGEVVGVDPKNENNLIITENQGKSTFSAPKENYTKQVEKKKKEEKSESSEPKEGDPGTVTLYHGSSESDDFEVNEGGTFGGVFTTTDPSTAHGSGTSEKLSKVTLRNSEVMTQSDLNQADEKKVNKLISEKLRNKPSASQAEAVSEIIIGDKFPSEDLIGDSDLQSLFGTTDRGEVSWAAQKIRGQIAKSLGFKAIEMDDEHGTSIMVLPGVKMKKADK